MPSIILPSRWRQQPPQGVQLKYPSLFLHHGATPGAVFTGANYGTGREGIVARITDSGINARVEFAANGWQSRINGTSPWTLIGLQYFASAPSAHVGIIALRNSQGPTLCVFDGTLQFYTDSGFVSSGLSAIPAGLHCIALTHRGDGSGTFLLDGTVVNVSGLGATANASSTLTLMNWDGPSGANYSPGINSYSAFAAVLPVALPTPELRDVTRYKDPWRLFKPHRRVLYFETAGTSQVTSDLADSYAIRAAVAQDCADSYAIRSAITQDLADSYALRALANGDLADSYAIRAAINADLADDYDIQTSGTVTSDLADSYAIRSAVAQDVSDSYAIRAAVQASLADAYSVRAAVQASLADAYTIITATSADLDDAYVIRAQVAADMVDSYAVFASSGSCPSAAEIAAAVRTELAAELANMDAPVSDVPAAVWAHNLP